MYKPFAFAAGIGKLLLEIEPGQALRAVERFFEQNGPRLFWVLFLFIIGCITVKALLRIIRNMLKRSRIDETQHAFIFSLTKITCYLLLVITCLGVLGVPMTPLITALGAAGLALSLALQDTLGNIAGGISVLFSRPFSKGNFVDIGGRLGTVGEIGLVYTMLRTIDNKQVYLPNGDVAKSTIFNFSREKMRRLDLQIPVRATAEIDSIRKIVLEEIYAAPLALGDPAPIVRASEQTLAVIKLTCMVWVEAPNYLELNGYLIEKIRARLTKEGFYPE